MINIAARHTQWSGVVPLIDRAFGQLRYLTSPEHADLELKERALARTAPITAVPGRYQPTDTIMAFLDNL